MADSESSSIDQIDHTSRGLGRLPYKFNKENYQKLFSIYLGAVDDIETAFLDLAGNKDVDTVTGIWLDYLGKWLGLSRSGRTDDEYRTALLLKISSYVSSGTPDDLIADVKTYTNASSDNVYYAENILAFFTILIDYDSDEADDIQNIDSSLYDLVEDLRPAGVASIIAASYGNPIFRPAWETTTSDSSAFETTDDGDTYVDFQTTSDGSSYGYFYTTSTTTSYADTDLEDEAIPAWEYIDTSFQVSVDGGETYEDLLLNGDTLFTNLIFLDTDDVEYYDDSERYLQWEVTSDSTTE